MCVSFGREERDIRMIYDVCRSTICVSLVYVIVYVSLSCTAYGPREPGDMWVGALAMNDGYAFCCCPHYVLEACGITVVAEGR